MAAIRDSFRLFLCARCKKLVLICSRCDRGQIYCKDGCSQIRRSETIRRAVRKYQKSELGARNHARRQALYRENKKNVTHQGSTDTPLEDKLSAAIVACLIARCHIKDRQPDLPTPTRSETRYCHFCGRPATDFVRFVYLGSKEAPG